MTNNDWAWQPLSEVANFFSGGTPRKSDATLWDGDIPWISASSMHNGRVSDSDRKVSTAAIGNGTRLAKQGSTLILVRGMSLLDEIRICHVMRDVAFNQDVKGLVARPGIDPWFLTYSLQAREPELLQMVHLAGHGTGVLSTDRLKNFMVGIPHKDEQRRIAGVLGALDDLIDTNERLAEKLDQLFMSLWLKYFGGLDHNAGKTLEDLGKTQYGVTVSASKDSRGPKLLRVTDINKRNWVQWAEVPSCEINDSDLAKYQLHVGDLVVARMADPGKSAIVEHDVDAVFASYLVRLVPSDPAFRYFLFGYLKSSYFDEYSQGAMTGSVQKHMNAKIIAAAPIARPTEDSVAAFNKIAIPVREQLAACIEEARELRQTRDELLPLLMSGKVRVLPEADDEQASQRGAA